MTSLRLPSLLLAAVVPLLAATQPTVNEKAPDFSLSTPEGKSISLSEVNAKGPVVLIVLRGYPGYQCPYCNRQAQDFIHSASSFADAGAHVIMVYPGPGQDLGAKAHEFLANKKMPDSFDLVLDPDYKFTNMYGLRWEGTHETAYPSTFLIDSKGMIFFTKVVKEHGARTTSAEVLDAFPKRKPGQ